MHLKGFHRVFLPSIFVALLYCISAVDHEYQCPYDIHVQKGQIIKAKESVDNGATFLKHSAVLDARECYKLCCERRFCDLAQIQYKNSSNGYFVQVEKICYMFHCGVPSRCSFGDHDHYATIRYDRPGEELSNLDGDQYKIPTKKVNKPSWRSQHRPSEPEGESEEKDLGSKSYKPPSKSQQPAKETEQSKEHKDQHSSWNTEYEVEKVDSSKKLKESGEATYHIKNMEKPIYQKPETPVKQVEVETVQPVVPVKKVTEKPTVQPPTQKDVDDADAELEMKLEELAPSEKHPDAKANPPTTFHHWREFVDNNPNFPYTIPVKPKKTTQKPTTKKQYKEPRTEHHTTEKTTTRKTTVKTEPRKTTERTTTTTAKPTPHEDKTHDEVAHTVRPPIIEFPLPHNNVSDVVVIETHRLKIIENKAVLPLAVFLVLAILLLFVVALRLRIVKSKLKRRPFATDDADYLINGMYL